VVEQALARKAVAVMASTVFFMDKSLSNCGRVKSEPVTLPGDL
jgi:hypothetical protein